MTITWGETLARIRTIKPEFFTSLTIADLQLTARLTFIGLWTQVDDEGRSVDDARLVKAAIWPLDDRTAADVEQDLAELHRLRLITRYEVEGRRYFCIRNWKEHQRINKPSKSKLPAPPEVKPGGPDDGQSVPGGLPEGSRNVPGMAREGSPGVPGGAPSRSGDAADSDKSATGGAGEDGGAEVARQPVDNPPITPPTWANEHSRNTPGILPEHSRGERKGREGNREQGKEVMVPAVGGLTDRNARACETAPPAQPEDFLARKLIHDIPRYRDAPPWARKHLADLAAAALAAGFGPAAIAGYAVMVITERRFAEHQHIPELRDALRRLNRDATLGTACMACGFDPGACECRTQGAAPDRPWTAADQADLERTLEHLGVTPDDLAREA